MDSNPYAPPNSAIADVPLYAYEDQDATVFFPVSLIKLLVMSFCTLGLYEYYWFYKNWKFIRDKAGEDISPFWRTFWTYFFCYQLFDRVRKQGADTSAKDLLAGPLATAWIIATLLWKLPGAYWLASFFAIFALLPVQSAINAINRHVAPNHDTNSRFTKWNWVAVVLGVPFLILAVIGSFSSRI